MKGDMTSVNRGKHFKNTTEIKVKICTRTSKNTYTTINTEREKAELNLKIATLMRI